MNTNHPPSTHHFWSCRCSDESPTYLHNAHEIACPICKIEKGKGQSAWVSEVLAWPHRERLDAVLFAEMLSARPRRKLYTLAITLLIEADHIEQVTQEADRVLTSQLQGNSAGVSHLVDWSYYIPTIPEGNSYINSALVSLPYLEVESPLHPQWHAAQAILDEAERSLGLKSLAQERAANGNWPNPETISDYLFWVEDEMSQQGGWPQNRRYANQLRKVAEGLRQLGFLPSIAPWERGE
jgi:hypothetical protein